MRRLGLAFFSLLVFRAPLLDAQNTSIYGSIVGTAADPSGAAAPDVRVTVTNVDTGISNSARICVVSGALRNLDTASIQWDAVTHICFRSVTLLRDGAIGRPAGNPPPAFLDAARQRGVKVCVLAWSNNSQDTDSYLANHSQDTTQSLLAYVRENGLDGITYDVSAFLQNLYPSFKSANPDYHIAYAAPPVIASTDRFATDWLDWAAISGSVDAIIPMLYTPNPPSIGWSTSPEPLAGSKPTAQTVARDVTNYYSALGDGKSKLLLGINSFPWSGYEFRCRTAERLSSTLGAGKIQPFDYMESQAALWRWPGSASGSWMARMILPRCGICCGLASPRRRPRVQVERRCFNRRWARRPRSAV